MKKIDYDYEGRRKNEILGITIFDWINEERERNFQISPFTLFRGIHTQFLFLDYQELIRWNCTVTSKVFL